LNTPTQATVPLADHLALARLGAEMLRAQRAYFRAVKHTPHAKPVVEWQAVRRAERAFKAAVEDALARDRRPLPGMEPEGGAT
jgi:hypothetical protein